MEKKNTYLVFGFMVVAQLVAAYYFIYQYNAVKHKGVMLKLEMEGVDPNDLLRGKYVTVNIKPLKYPRNKDKGFDKKDNYLLYSEDGAFQNIVQDEPSTPYYIKATKQLVYQEDSVQFEFPINRFYVEESKALPMEDIIRKELTDNQHPNVKALVYAYNGQLIIQDILIRDTSISVLAH